MEGKFWLQRWQNGEIGFHRPETHTYLCQFHAQTFKSKSTILVPLCGKSLDMIYLAKQGHKVVGVEISLLACQQFFTENNLTRKNTQNPNLWTCKEFDISIYCQDFFDFDWQKYPDITAIYDRAALIALPLEIRARYGDFICQNIAKREINYLLISIVYPNSSDGQFGPPFSVPKHEIENIFGRTFKIKPLASATQKTILERFTQNGISEITETAYILSNT